MAARVEVPVDHRDLRVLCRSGDDLVVHADVRVMGCPKGQPEDVLDVRGLERGQDVLDLRRIVIGEVV